METSKNPKPLFERFSCTTWIGAPDLSIFSVWTDNSVGDPGDRYLLKKKKSSGSIDETVINTEIVNFSGKSQEHK